MTETAKRPLFNADAAEEYFTNLCTYYRDSRNQMFKKDNEGRNTESSTSLVGTFGLTRILDL